MDGGNKDAQQGEDAAGGWQYVSGSTQSGYGTTTAHEDTPRRVSAVPQDAVEWTASEFIGHDKGFGWYVLLVIGAIVLVGATYLLTRDVFSTTIIAILALIIGIISARKPRVVTYRLDNSGVHIGTRHYAYGSYKSFVVLTDGPFASVALLPMQRFGFTLSMYLAPENEQEVLEVLGRHLPLEHGKVDGIEQLMRRLRF